MESACNCFELKLKYCLKATKITEQQTFLSLIQIVFHLSCQFFISKSLKGLQF